MEFNEKLQLLRSQRGLTQEELAAEIFVSRTAVSKWESGRGYPSIDSLKELARFFEVTVDVLISDKELSEITARARRMRERGWSITARIRGIACGILDICALAFLFMPLFRLSLGCLVMDVNVLEYRDGPMRTLYLFAILGTVFLGVFSLIAQTFYTAFFQKAGLLFTIIAGLGLLLLFIASRMPYAAAVALLFLVIKAFFLIKQW